MGNILHSLLVITLLAVGHYAGLFVMSRFRIMEHLLSPGGHTDLYVMAVAAAFMVLRLWLFLLAPAMLLVRIWQFIWARFAPRVPEAMVETVRVDKTVKWVEVGKRTSQQIPSDEPDRGEEDLKTRLKAELRAELTEELKAALEQKEREKKAGDR